MDDDLIHKYAPRRNKRYGHLPQFVDLCNWAESLDWQNNDAHFMILAKRVIESVDDDLREKSGRRVDQIADGEELSRAMRFAASWYDPEFRNIFIHLRVYVSFYLQDKLEAQSGAARKFPDFEHMAQYRASTS